MQEDLYNPHPMVQDIVWGCLHKAVEPLLMQWPLYKLRQKALNAVMHHIHHEDHTTNYLCIGPLSKVSLSLFLHIHYYIIIHFIYLLISQSIYIYKK